MPDPRSSIPAGRRDFLLKLGAGAGVAGLAAQAAAALRALVPDVTYDPPPVIRSGRPPGELPDGLTFLPDARVFVVRSGRSFHAISAVCTHLGCTVRPEALSQPEDRAVGGRMVRLTHCFACSCHGSRYRGDGANLSGPAPSPLPWFKVFVTPDDGQLAVDTAAEVPAGHYVTLS